MELSATVRRLSATALETARKIPKIPCGNYSYETPMFGPKVPVCQIDDSGCPFASSQEWRNGDTVYFCRRGVLSPRAVLLLERIALARQLPESQIPWTDVLTINSLVEHGLVRRKPQLTRVADGKGHVTETSVDYYLLKP